MFLPFFKKWFLFLSGVALLGIFALNAHYVSAAQILFQDQGSLEVNHIYEVTVSLNPENQSINAVEGVVTFPDSVLEVQHISSDNSIVGEWIEQPNLKNKLISFSGIIPHGFNGLLSPFQSNPLPGNLFTIAFRVKDNPQGTISAKDIHAYLNDGSGAEVSTTIIPLPLDPHRSLTDIHPLAGTIPTTFTPVVAQNPQAYDGKSFVIFSTRAEAGINHYDIQENRSGTTTEDAWIKAESPYVLQDQTLQSYIFIRAVDNQGNSRIAVVSPTNTPTSLISTSIFEVVIIGIVLFLICYGGMFLVKKIYGKK